MDTVVAVGDKTIVFSTPWPVWLSCLPSVHVVLKRCTAPSCVLSTSVHLTVYNLVIAVPEDSSFATALDISLLSSRCAGKSCQLSTTQQQHLDTCYF